MKLREIRQSFYDASGKVSDLSRQLAFAGIGLIWVFHADHTPGVAVPPVLVAPALLFAAALFSDLLQYVVTTVVWGSLAWREERKRADPSVNHDVVTPVWAPFPQLVPFTAKILLVGAGYVRLLGYLWSVRPR